MDSSFFQVEFEKNSTFPLKKNSTFPLKNIDYILKNCYIK